jgi:hypothetical protein
VTTTGERRHAWRHEWVPLTMRAALQKAKGNRELAQRYLDEARAHRQARRDEAGPVEFVPPTPAHRAAAADRAQLRGATDDELAEDLADALGAGDEAAGDRILSELDRRDRAERRAQAQRARRAGARAARDEARERAYDEALAAGDDPQEAYARVYGVSEERQRRQEAEADLRANGYAGKTFGQMVGSAHGEHVRQAYLDAEAACRGHLLNAAGQAAGVDPESLWSGPAARAKKYGSPELLDYFRDNGRLTVQDFAASLLGGAAKFRTAGDDW